ncbi:MAG: zinc-dependent alcohol dehydrogenase [Candidatus Heimdallarchaeota archaeon]
MRRQIVTSPGIIEFSEEPIPKIVDDEVLVKIIRIGICGSDIHVYHGKHPNTGYPVTQGHEVSGVIEKIGKQVTDFTVGDKVTILPQIVCGKCYPCTHDQYHICDKLKVKGFQAPGAAVEYFVTKKEELVKLPEEFTYEQGALIEPVAVAVAALKKIDEKLIKNVVVLGGGPIGNLTAQVAKARGAKAVLLTELSEFRREIAKKVGIDHVINPRKIDLAKKIEKVFGSDKADIICDCVGSNETITEAINIARKGSTIILVGVYNEQPPIDLNTIQNCELTLKGTLMYQRSDYQDAITMVYTKRVTLEPLMTHHYKFKDYNQAYLDLEKNADNTMKVFINVDE